YYTDWQKFRCIGHAQSRTAIQTDALWPYRLSNPFHARFIYHITLIMLCQVLFVNFLFAFPTVDTFITCEQVRRYIFLAPAAPLIAQDRQTIPQANGNYSRLKATTH